MTEHEQRVAIAEWMGYVVSHGGNVEGKYVAQGSTVMPMPDYTRDLNAMHEVLARLESNGSWRKWIWWLEHRMNLGHIEDGCRERDTTTEMLLINATAAQICEALLRTLGLWRDEPSEP